jgi:formylmethanofuran dehydrogenase subunit C
MRGGDLIIEGEATRPCANMKEGSCVILGIVYDLLPTFERVDRRVLPEWKITADVYRGDVANRGKGTLMIKNSGAK